MPASAFVWTSSRDGQIQTGSNSFLISDLSVGLHTITLTVTDKDGASSSKSIGLTITAPNQSPTANITSPANNSRYNPGDIVSFMGIGTDPEDDILPATAFAWTSSRDGLINSGNKNFSKSNLSVGSHTITLTVTDSKGASNSKSINLTITSPNQSPTAAITSPANNSSYTLGQSITFTGTGTDSEDGTLSASAFAWTSSRDGLINSGNKSFSKANLSVGQHTITLTVTDSKGASNSKSINVNIASPNQPPTAVITSPANNSSYTFGDIVSFVGTGTDPEDGTLPVSAFVWTSSRDGQINSGSKSFSISTLSAGTHNITLTVTDSDGGKGITTRTVIINSLIDNYSGTYTGTFTSDSETLQGTYTATLVISSINSGRLTVEDVQQDYYNSDVTILSLTDEEMLIEFEDADGDTIQSTLNRTGDSLSGSWNYLNPDYTASGYINVNKVASNCNVAFCKQVNHYENGLGVPGVDTITVECIQGPTGATVNNQMNGTYTITGTYKLGSFSVARISLHFGETWGYTTYTNAFAYRGEGTFEVSVTKTSGGSGNLYISMETGGAFDDDHDLILDTVLVNQGCQ